MGSKKKSAKQQTLKGMAGKRIPGLDNAMVRYVALRDRRMALTPLEVAARQAMETIMKKHNKKTYRHSNGQLQVKLEPTEEKAKVSRIKDKTAE